MFEAAAAAAAVGGGGDGERVSSSRRARAAGWQRRRALSTADSLDCRPPHRRRRPALPPSRLPADSSASSQLRLPALLVSSSAFPTGSVGVGGVGSQSSVTTVDYQYTYEVLVADDPCTLQRCSRAVFTGRKHG